MRIVWIASYPKSGNTWVRFLLYNYLYGEVTDSESVHQRIPSVHGEGKDKLTDPGDGPLLSKTHFMLSPKHPYVDKTAGFIYILRNPKDVLLSNLNFYKISSEEDISDEAYARDFINVMGVRHWRKMGMGSWVEHISSWLSATVSVPHVMLRYEEMKAAPEENLERIIRFLGKPVDAGRIADAVTRSSFDSMRAMETREREHGKAGAVFNIKGTAGTDTGKRFLNEGKSGQSLAHISPEVDALFDKRFGDVQRVLGY
ncbi:MAG: sulfotransferase domain-containing protein [Leptospirillia bacterium]